MDPFVLLQGVVIMGSFFAGCVYGLVCAYWGRRCQLVVCRRYVRLTRRECVCRCLRLDD